MDLSKNSKITSIKTPANSVLIGLATLLIVIGVVLSPSISHLFEGFKFIMVQPSTLDFDVFAQAGMNVGFFNSGILLLAIIIMFNVTKTEVKGVQIAAAFMVLGFAMYGKNLLNMWFPIAGVFLYGKYSNKKANEVSTIAAFSTAAAPVFSVLAFGTDSLSNPFLAIIIGTIFGILSGFMIGYFCEALPNLHNGCTLYNAGFAAGLTTFILNSLFKLIGIGHDKIPYVEINTAIEKGIKSDFFYGENIKIAIILLLIFAYMIMAGILLNGHKSYKKLFLYKSKGGDYAEEFGFGVAFINVGVVGIFAVIFVFTTIKGQFAGTVSAAIFTAAGFGAAGVTFITQGILMYGVFLSAFITNGIDYASSRGMLLSAIFSIGIAPIVADFGFIAGIIATFCHIFLVTNTGVLHGYMSLYNNGLSLSLIATFMSYFFMYNRKKSLKSIS